MRIPNPAQLFDGLLDVLPVWISGPLRWFYTIFVWVTLPISLLSAISDLKAFIEFCQWALTTLPDFSPYFLWIGRTCHIALTFWRDVTAPLREWLHTILPWQLPDRIADLVFLCLATAPSWLRLFFTQLDYSEREALKAQFEEQKSAVKSQGKEEGVGVGGGAILGGIVGGLIGIIFPPALPAAVSLGAAIGGGAGGEDEAQRESAYSGKLRDIESKLEAEELRLFRAASRLRHARLLVVASMICLIIAVGVILVDWQFYR